MQQVVTKGKIGYKHHAYTFSNYTNCVYIDQLEHLMKGDDRIQVWVQDLSLVCNNYMLW